MFKSSKLKAVSVGFRPLSVRLVMGWAKNRLARSGLVLAVLANARFDVAEACYVGRIAVAEAIGR